MSILLKIKAKKNTDRLMNICADLIYKYEQLNEDPHVVPSCKNDLLASVKVEMDAAYEEIAGWKDSEIDYIRVAHSALARHSFDLLASGKYHIYTGMLNPMSCASNIMSVYSRCMQWGVERGELTEEERKEQSDYLHRQMSIVG